jgi:ferredoxin
MKVHADRGRCVAAGQCILAAPEVFDQAEEDGIVIVRLPEPPAEAHRAVRDAVRDCPVRALSLS